MSSTASSRTFASAFTALLILTGCASPAPGKLLFRDDFNDLSNWHIEAEKPGRIGAANGVLDIDAPAGVTLWFKHYLEGPLTIEFEATAVAEGGSNDLIADGPQVEYWRDGEPLFRLEGAAPYTGGWFALRTTQSHLRIRHLRIRRLP